MSAISLWQSFEDATNFDQLDSDINVDVAIIGGGITGIGTAELLKTSGLKIAVLESFRVGTNTSGHSTGNLYEVMGQELIQVWKKHGSKGLSKVIESRREAINIIENNVHKYQLDCDFVRVPFYLYSANDQADKKIQEEHEAAREIDLAFTYADLAHPVFKSDKCLKIENQAQFNPLRYVQGLAKKIDDDTCLIYENTKVESVSSEGEKNILKTSKGTVRAKYVIHATHTPKGIMGYHSLLGPYREFGIACKIKDPQHPPGIYFGFYEPDAITSTRLYQRNGESYLVVVGEHNKVGEGSESRKIKMLENFAAKFFDVEKYTHRWGAQHYRPADELPYIGRRAKNSNTFVATGYSTHGLTFGTVAAKIISDLILGKENPYAEIYDATRITLLKSSKNILKENASIMGHLVKDYLLADQGVFSEVSVGEGKVIQYDGQKLAVYRDENEDLKICSAVCSHMGCVVHWNEAETSWDCPCHGSRFDTQGEVLEGPALHALASVDLESEKIKVRKNPGVIKDNFQTGLGL